MDQDSFRRLLESGSGSSKPSQKSRGSLLVSGGKAASARKTLDASEPAFKPRKVKKSDGKYRDRAAERRVGDGTGNDYAQVEAVLEDFEKRLADNNATDEQRKYLGGDSDHSILVKGLDVALMEQNKARASLSTVDDDSLEQAFMGAASEPTAPKKRTREDMIRELKEKRGIKSSTPAPMQSNDALEAAKKQGKFKPIGFKPIGGEEKPKRKKVKADGTEGERKKKKRKIEAAAATAADNGDEGLSLMPPPPLPSSKKDLAPATSSSRFVPPDGDAPDDFDIFAGAGEYEGIDLGEEDDEENTGEAKKSDNRELEDGEEPPDLSRVAVPGKWFQEDELDPVPSTSKLPLPPMVANQRPPADEEEEEEMEHPTRLVPLSSSALPSIKDLLAMDKAANSSEKRKKRKDKKGGKDDGDDVPPKQKMTAEVKAERDYKRLKSYTDKKAGVSSAQ
ncbi:hypothetical protein C8R43DRAFT_1103367 [Mycena crocata]|nr:hypothetical protein C8R43DRAFT_1103367 [Mycena crocata]